ncbi:methyltransferase domain-containing protein [Paenibacillus thermotolerans]|uniref:methyltransferase domain-containing protein n=1 Tax=Paenibacillus thermotolerans TaxID=3027807 RepID=UPI0023686439|nr:MULTISPECIES: methyltransferase domain-containing protein [unclassified Paenibacillus]
MSARPVYMSTMLPGLESIVTDEIKHKIKDARVVETLRGKVFFSSEQPLGTLMSLRSVDNLYAFVRKFSIGPHKIHLQQLEKEMEAVDLSKAISPDLIESEGVTFAVNSSRSGNQTYSRFDLSEAAGRGLLKQLPKWKIGTAEAHQLEFRLDLSGDQAIFCFRLTPSTFRFRGNLRLFSQAALRPSVAHALVWHSQPMPDDMFVDPFCGSGTIVAERAAYPFGHIVGGDISAEAAEAATQNAPKLDRLIVRQWDARELPLDASSVDAVVSNLPFGEQILQADEIYDLYLKLMKQFKRVMKPGSRAVLMTDKTHELRRAADKFGIEHYVDFEVSLKGLHPNIFTLHF